MVRVRGRERSPERLLPFDLHGGPPVACDATRGPKNEYWACQQAMRCPKRAHALLESPGWARHPEGRAGETQGAATAEMLAAGRRAATRTRGCQPHRSYLVQCARHERRGAVLPPRGMQRGARSAARASEGRRGRRGRGAGQRHDACAHHASYAALGKTVNSIATQPPWRSATDLQLPRQAARCGGVASCWRHLSERALPRIGRAAAPCAHEIWLARYCCAMVGL